MTRHEGFWRDHHWDVIHLWLPWPHARTMSWRGEADFLAALDKVEAHLRATEQEVGYRGMSTCRLCPPCEEHMYWNGSREFTHPKWAWPEGLRHYVQVHHLRPSWAFRRWIRHQATQLH
jgi:hypothetical protein